MITFTYLSLFIVIIVFFILYFLNKNEKSIRLKASGAIIDSITFSAGVIMILYLIGLAWEIEYLKGIDEFSLGLALIVASIALIADILDKYKNINKKKKKDQIHTHKKRKSKKIT